jgi:thiamine-phosphate pyrophosphorylase
MLVTDRQACGDRRLEEVVEAAVEGGVNVVQLREKDLPAAERRAILTELVELGRPFCAVVMAHDDIDAVLATGAAGVHLPGGADPAAARARLADALIGASAHSPSEAAALLEAGVDYVTLSPIFLTESKPGYGPALGLDALRAASGAGAGPIIALAGIDETNAAQCLAAGAYGIAVMGEVMRSTDPEATIRALLRAIAPP